MTLVEIPIDLKKFDKKSADLEILNNALSSRATAETLFGEERYIDALERTVESMRVLREFSDLENMEFRTLLVGLLFDLAEIHYQLKDYKQSEKELDALFKLLEQLMKVDEDRFSKYHILAMELSTRILRSRKKTIDLLVKQQINAGNLYEKVNSGVIAATDKLVDSLRNVGQLLASSGDYRGAMKFYAEAIKISKKKAGRVTRKEVKLTVEMAKIMMRVKQMVPRAKRLLNAILPHAIALETIELEEDILALIEIIDSEKEQESAWKLFMHKITTLAKRKRNESDPSKSEEVAEIEENVVDQMAREAVKEEKEKEKKKKKK